MWYVVHILHMDYSPISWAVSNTWCSAAHSHYTTNFHEGGGQEGIGHYQWHAVRLEVLLSFGTLY